MTSDANLPDPTGDVLLRATRDEAAGAAFRVAGLMVIEGNLKQVLAADQVFWRLRTTDS